MQFKKLRNGCATARGRTLTLRIEALLESAEIMTLTLSSKGVSSPLWDRTPSGKEELVNALGHITSHSLPLGSPSFARYANLNFSYTIAEVENTKGMLFY